MAEIISRMGDRQAVLAREMTKLHEEFLRGPLSQILSTIKARPAIKGEFTLLVSGCEPSKEMDIDAVKIAIKTALDDDTGSPSEIARTIAQKYGLAKKKVYDLVLELRGQKSEVKGQDSEDRPQKSENRKLKS